MLDFCLPSLETHDFWQANGGTSCNARRFENIPVLYSSERWIAEALSQEFCGAWHHFAPSADARWFGLYPLHSCQLILSVTTKMAGNMCCEHISLIYSYQLINILFFFVFGIPFKCENIYHLSYAFTVIPSKITTTTEWNLTHRFVLHNERPSEPRARESPNPHVVQLLDSLMSDAHLGWHPGWGWFFIDGIDT